MDTLEHFRSRLATVTDLKSIVATMKTLAAARIRQFESVANATNAYFQSVESALQLLLRQPHRMALKDPGLRPTQPIGVVLLGTDQGFCGRFNYNIAKTAQDIVNESENLVRRKTRFICVGAKLTALLQSRGDDVDQFFSVPASAAGINAVVRKVLIVINDWRQHHQIESIQLVYHRRQKASPPQVFRNTLLPLSPTYLDQLMRRPWDSRALPICLESWPIAFSKIIQQLLFIQVYRAVAESLASENASRIAAMQQAETTIDRRLERLNVEYNQARQQQITAELRDIISGFECLPP